MIKKNFDIELDTIGLHCPLPLLKCKQQLRHMSPGQILFVRASDAGSFRDIPAYIETSPHELIVAEVQGDDFAFYIRCQ